MGAQRSHGTRTTVAGHVIRNPRTTPLSATVLDVWELFANRRVHMALLTSGDHLLGCVTRGDLVGAPMAAPAIMFASTRGRTISSALPIGIAWDLLETEGIRRIAAVDDDHCLVGLLCLKQSRAGFCSDIDIESRAAERQTGAGPARSAQRGEPDQLAET